MLGYRPGDDINKAIAEGRISGLAIKTATPTPAKPT